MTFLLRQFLNENKTTISVSLQYPLNVKEYAIIKFKENIRLLINRRKFKI